MYLSYISISIYINLYLSTYLLSIVIFFIFLYILYLFFHLSIFISVILYYILSFYLSFNLSLLKGHIRPDDCGRETACSNPMSKSPLRRIYGLPHDGNKDTSCNTYKDVHISIQGCISPYYDFIFFLPYVTQVYFFFYQKYLLKTLHINEKNTHT